MPTYDEDDVRDFRGRGHGREDELEHGRGLPRCNACAQPTKDHTAPATKRCAAMAARRANAAAPADCTVSAQGQTARNLTGTTPDLVDARLNCPDGGRGGDS